MPIVNPQHPNPYRVGYLYLYRQEVVVMTKLNHRWPSLRSLSTLRSVSFAIDFITNAVYIPYQCAYSSKHRAKTRAKIAQFRLTYPELFI